MRTGRPALNLSGKKFTRLQVIKACGSVGRDRVWQCLCECGKLITVRAFALKSGNTRSCGCLKREAVIKRNIETGVRVRLKNPPRRIDVSNTTLGGFESMFSEACSFEIFNTAGWKGKSAIYALINKVTGKLYVGSASCLKGRIGYHWSKLRNGKHDNSYLQRSWTLHGAVAFSVVIIEQCPIESLMEREGFWIKKTKSADKSFGYNLDSIAVRKMHSQETKNKISLAHRGKPKSPEHRANLSKGKMGIKLGSRKREAPKCQLHFSEF